MKLYHASSHQELKETTFVHFGSLCAAAHRIESKFLNPHRMGYRGQGRVVFLDEFGRNVREESFEDALEAFAQYASSHTMRLFEVNVVNPLLLNDLWDDDPIASGGIGIVNREELTEAQNSQLKALFAPFEGVMMPLTVLQELNERQLQQAKTYCDNNPLARRQLTARKRRSRILGEDWRLVGPYECVWVQRTVEFRRWAILNGYDGLTYQNEREGHGELSFVCIHEKQAKPVQRLTFDRDLYLSRTRPIFEAFIQALSAHPDGFHHHVFWAGMEPEEFWREQP